jgi:hypothetical protein
MVQIALTVTQACDGEAGSILVKRIDGSEPKEMGTIKFESSSDKRWLLMVLMDMHPYVSLKDQAMPCDPAIKKNDSPC